VPVPLWLYPAPDLGAAPAAAEERDPDDETATRPALARSARARKRGEYVEDIDGRTGLIAFRLESLFSWSEYVPVDRTEDDSDDEDAARVAEDLDQISLTHGADAPASRLRLDLDLPAAAEDDLPLGEGRLLPEWDWRRAALRPDYCRIIPMLARDAPPAALPDQLAPVAARLRKRFEALRPDRLWSARRPQGRELDIEACIRFQAERRRGGARADAALWRELETRRRDLACLVLADLSLSTEAWLDDSHQVIDVVRDSLQLLGEALDAGGDRFAFYGFSSKRRDHVRFNMIKNFAEAWGDPVRGRIQALKPGYYTRMGAAIRQATEVLARQPTSQRLLLMLTDGKPNDLDIYEGRYGVEDTRQALIEARRSSVEPFCVTIDQDAADYLPYIFGQQRYVLLRQPAQLPELLPKLYLLLTGRPS
jgi:nitric oxide reductase NorD protein